VFGKKSRSLFSRPQLSEGSLPLLLSGSGIFKGELFSHGDGVIDATFSGPSRSDSLLGVGANGKVEGSLEGRDISLAGHYKGDATAREHFMMKKGCQVRGRCRSHSLEVEEGSDYEGLLIIGIEDKDLTSSGKLRA
jgi:cytoskeletal protein CcmA (bactofilin family)